MIYCVSCYERVDEQLGGRKKNYQRDRNLNQREDIEMSAMSGGEK